MGREVRMVPPNWQHPIEWRKKWQNKAVMQFKPLMSGPYSERVAEWTEGAAQWESGLKRDYATNGWKPKDQDDTGTYAEYDGERPVEADYMPAFAPGTATHLMMYESTSEGTPISPALATPEELARWLSDNGASTFGDSTGTYEQWLRTCRGGWAPSAVFDQHGLRSGVEALADLESPSTES
jgi:hypothetical protein